MNGRIYDPLLGRFLSADLVVQNPDSLQSYNRYSYVMNNPLTLTDPSGFNWISDTMQAAADFERGAVYGIAEANLPDAINPTPHGDSPESTATTAGRVVGNLAAMLQGSGEAAGGTGMMAGGAATAGVGGVFGIATSETGVGALVGVGAVAVGAAEATVGAAVTVHGVAVGVNAGSHLIDNVAKLTAGSSKTGSDGGKVDQTKGAASDKKGVVYKVPGKDTPSGKPYVGRTSSPEGPPGRGKVDGRDRTNAKVVDTYKNTKEGRVKEQKAIDKDGLDKLDNKRNEIDPKKREQNGLPPATP